MFIEMLIKHKMKIVIIEMKEKLKKFIIFFVNIFSLYKSLKQKNVIYF